LVSSLPTIEAFPNAGFCPQRSAVGAKVRGPTQVIVPFQVDCIAVGAIPPRLESARLGADRPSGVIRKDGVKQLRHQDKPRIDDAFYNLPLRIYCDRNPSCANGFDQLRLLHLPSVRDAVGLLPKRRSQNFFQARNHIDLRLGKEVAPFCSLQRLRLRYPLGAN
jgi:hypothetical protein